MTLKNYVLTSILTFFHQKFCRVATLPSSPLPTGFTAITDHPSAGEVPLGRGPQCGAAPIKFRSVSGPGLRRMQGWRVLSQAGLPLFLSGPITVAAQFWADSRNCSAQYIHPKYRERLVYTSWKRGQNRADPGSLQTSQTPVDLGLSILSSFILTSGIFIKSHPLCLFYGEMCKKSLRVWPIYRSQEVVENLTCQVGSKDVNVSSLGLFWVEQSSFEDANMVCEELSGARHRQKPLGSFCPALNDHCLAQDRLRALKLVSLKPPGIEDSEYVFNIFFIACLWTNRQCEMSDQFRKSLCDDIDVR
jgi:hypothetical protein